MATKILHNDWFAFGHDQHFVFDAMTSSSGLQSFERLIHWLIAKTKCSVMHRNHSSCAEFSEGADGFFRIHVNLSPGRSVISPDGEECDIDIVMFADLAKPREKCAVAAVKECSPFDFDSEAAKSSMEISQETRAPVITRR